METPIIPPNVDRMTASATISHAIAPCEYPRVFKTACSEILLRTAIRIVLAINPITANTEAIPIHLEKDINSISYLAVLAKKAFSGLVLVGSGSFLNLRSI